MSDPKKRAAYDQHGHAGVDPNMSGAGAQGFTDAFGDIFGDIFGARGGQANVYRGADLRYNLEISLEQAARGTETKIRIPTMDSVRDLPWQRRQAGHVAHHVPYLPRPRPGTNAAGIFLDPADMPQMPWQRQIHFEPLHYLQRCGARQATQDAVGKDPGRGG